MSSWQFPVTRKGNPNLPWRRSRSLEKRAEEGRVPKLHKWGSVGIKNPKPEIPREGGLVHYFWSGNLEGQHLKECPHQHGNDSRVAVVGWGAEAQKQSVMIVFHGFSGVL